MPHLPASPSLEHLRRQAKALLKALRAQEADALQRAKTHLPGLIPGHNAQPPYLQLTDAQLLLAREYGFPSWPKLKAHVDALAANAARTGASLTSPVKGRSARQQFVCALAEALVACAQQHDTPALGARFALMPLRDILAVRECLSAVGKVSLVVDGLLEGLGHNRPKVRFDCANALDHMADERCAEPLQGCLSDLVPRVRRAALHALSCDACKLSPLTPREDLLPTLLKMVQSDPSIRVRRAAVPLLESYCRDVRVEDALRSLAKQEDVTIKRTAREVLRRRGVSIGQA